MIILSSGSIASWAILLIVIGIFVVIGAVAFLIYFLLKRKAPKEEKPDEKKAAEETLSMYLEDVDDEEVQKEFKEYEENSKKKD